MSTKPSDFPRNKDERTNTLCEVIAGIVRAIVPHGSNVAVIPYIDQEGEVHIEVEVQDGDLETIVGPHGTTAEAIRHFTGAYESLWGGRYRVSFGGRGQDADY